MKAKLQLQKSLYEEQMRTALHAHWHARPAGDTDAEHDIYDDDVICDYPQSGERILGENICRPCGVIIPAGLQASR